MKEYKKMGSLIYCLFIFIIITLVLLFIYKFDNKYSCSSPQPINGILVLSENEINDNPVFYLIRDWVIYPGVLLTPSDLKIQSPSFYSKFTYIGQYRNMNSSSLQYDCATYKLTIKLPEKSRTYALELPEIFSAYNLYINDELLVSMGNIDPSNYKEAIQSKIISFTASGSIEILLSVSNNSGIYSGLIYPLSFGNLQDITIRRNINLILHSSAIVLALGVCVISLYFGIKAKQNTAILFVIICASYIGIIAYPLIHTFFVTKHYTWYIIEMLCHYFLYLLATLLQNKLYKIKLKPTIISLIPYVATMLLLLIYTLAPSLTKYKTIEIINLFINTSKYYCAAYLITISIIAVAKQKVYSRILLTSTLILSLTVIFDRVFPIFEPIYGGWFNEIGISALIIGYATTIWIGLIDGYQSNILLELNNQK